MALSILLLFIISCRKFTQCWYFLCLLAAVKETLNLKVVFPKFSMTCQRLSFSVTTSTSTVPTTVPKEATSWLPQGTARVSALRFIQGFFCQPQSTRILQVWISNDHNYNLLFSKSDDCIPTFISSEVENSIQYYQRSVNTIN